MSLLFQNYKRANIEFIKAENNELIDQKGRLLYRFFIWYWRN
ncbi:acetylornithine aminotransferase [Staphylococcus saccharolyticus]|uniref:Acetylornithine aminotransferase n=1 Tax=Staphylococcus saccharolyticus TaxID=33028 RepID=A0A380H3C8_9STAP|nr:acetylornithine aminotransferase [Staphylococcus saccharolyticus]